MNVVDRGNWEPERTAALTHAPTQPSCKFNAYIITCLHLIKHHRLINMSTSDYETAESIRDVLKRFPGWSRVDIKEADTADFKVHADVKGKTVEFLLEVKSGTWLPSALAKLRHRKCGKLPLVVASAWIPPKLARELRDEMKLNYLDTAGNAYLDFPGLHVFRETLAQPLVDATRQRPIGDAFSPSAVTVGLQLLLDPALVNTNLRNLGALAGVSPASAKFAMDAFKQDGYVLEAGKRGRRLVEREEFFRKWSESYNLRYRPRRSLGKYSLGAERLALDGDACWGGEQAADILTKNLKPGAYVVYMYSLKIGPLVAKNRLRPNPNGEVDIVQACWSQHQEGQERTAPVFIVYADLVNTHDPRCLEIAQRLFDTAIKDRLDGTR